MNRFSRIATLTCFVCLLNHAEAELIRFGNGDNSFELEFVPIGSPGNPADTRVDYIEEPRFIGSVPYEYGITKFELTCDVMNIANGLAEFFPPDSNFCYGRTGLMSPGGLTVEDSRKFVNWLNTSTGYHSAYEVEIRNREWEPGEAGYNPENPLRNAFARFSIANAHEFHKAAYFDPVSETYFDYASGSNVAPTPVAGGTEPDTLVVQRVLPTRAIFDADVNNAGALSAFGTMGQIGNAEEWEEVIRFKHRGRDDLFGFTYADTRTVRFLPDVANFRIVDHLAADTNGNDIIDLGDADGLSGSLRDDLFVVLDVVPGDLDGVDGVAFPDFLKLSDSFGKPGGYADGDIDGDGTVAFPDFLVMSVNYGKGAAAAVPEPSSALLLLMGVLLLRCRR